MTSWRPDFRLVSFKKIVNSDFLKRPEKVPLSVLPKDTTNDVNWLEPQPSGSPLQCS